MPCIKTHMRWDRPMCWTLNGDLELLMIFKKWENCSNEGQLCKCWDIIETHMRWGSHISWKISVIDIYLGYTRSKRNFVR